MSKWYAWTIVQNKYNKVIEFLQGLKCVDDFIYPIVAKKQVFYKKQRNKTAPLYNNYIFIKYKDTDTNKALLKECVWLKQFIGYCPQEEIGEILKNVENSESYCNKDLEIGMEVTLRSGHLTATIVDIKGDKFVVNVNIFGGVQTIECVIDDIVV
jgi:transcription antitermination factor NusG